MTPRVPRILTLVATAVSTLAAHAQIIVPGATGADGVLNRTSGNLEIDLSKAVTGVWDQGGGDVDGDGTGDGVYDPDKWAVVFKYSSVNIGAGVTVTFKNHPANPPVIWLVSGNVTINGTVSLDGKSGVNFAVAQAGPGGFRGGRAAGSQGKGSAGFGPGGAPHQTDAFGRGGSYGEPSANGCGFPGPAGPVYGNAAILPLIGGSGGASRHDHDPNQRTAGGGGAILIASTNTMTIGGTVRSNGGSNSQIGGSGGGIRLIANQVEGDGVLRAEGGSGCGPKSGGDGRIRVEANSIMMADVGAPIRSEDSPGATALIFPDVAAPIIRVVSVDGLPVPADPHARLDFPLADISTVCNPNPVTIVLECRNLPVPPATPAAVTLRIVPKSGDDQRLAAGYVSGNFALSTWQVEAALTNGFSALQAHAVLP